MIFLVQPYECVAQTVVVYRIEQRQYRVILAFSRPHQFIPQELTPWPKVVFVSELDDV